MGRKKSHAKSQVEQRDKLKRELGEEEFNNAEAERKRTVNGRYGRNIYTCIAIAKDQPLCTYRKVNDTRIKRP